MKVVVITHSTMSGGGSMFGPAHNIVGRLIERQIAVRLVEHSMQPGEPSWVTEVSSRGFSRRMRFGHPIEKIPGRYLFEVAWNLKELGRGGFDVAILIDPLNYFSALLWRIIPGRRTFRRVYYSADYATDRFSHAFINKAYHLLDRAALKDAEFIWAVSTSITDFRKQQGVESQRLRTVPNAPRFVAEAVVPREHREPNSVIVIAHFENTLDNELIYLVIKRISERNPDVRFKLVGPGPGASEIVERLEASGVSGVVEALGYKPHEEALALAARAMVGWAPYGRGAPWLKFGDSIKLREYAALGVPAVTTPGHGLADSAVSAVVSDAEQCSEALLNLLTDDREWTAAMHRSLEFAAKNDRAALVDAALADLGLVTNKF